MKKILGHKIAIVIEIILLVLSVVWYFTEKGMEPLIGIIGFVGSLIASIFFSQQNKIEVIKTKNAAINSKIKAKNIKIGDSGVQDSEKYDMKNIVEGGEINAEENIEIGDRK